MERTSDAGGWKQQERERERRFWAFSDEKKVGIVGTVDDRQCISISGKDFRQRCHGLVEREKMESWIGGAGVLWWCREKQRERERDDHFDFAKRGKAREAGSLNFSRSISSF